MIEKNCPYCNKKIIGNNFAYANHIRWCSKNPNYLNILNSTSTHIKKIKTKERYIYKFICEVCGNEYFLELSESDYKKGKYRKTCSDICSKKLTAMNSTDRNLSIHLAYTEKRELRKKVCPICNKEFYPKKKKQVCCSLSCGRKFNYMKTLSNKLLSITQDFEKIKLFKEVYAKECSFKFSLNSYKDEFDFNLIEKNGWYKPSNHGNNLSGISRDHIYAVMDGFNNIIDPYLISHPANCRLIIHTDNIKKGSVSLISYDELVKRVIEWNKKYGVYENKIAYNLFESLGFTIEKFEIE